MMIVDISDNKGDGIRQIDSFGEIILFGWLLRNSCVWSRCLVLVCCGNSSGESARAPISLWKLIGQLGLRRALRVLDASP